MIRILFRVPGVTGETLSTVHSAEVHGQKSALLLNPEIEIIGFEDCREQDFPVVNGVKVDGINARVITTQEFDTAVSKIVKEALRAHERDGRSFGHWIRHQWGQVHPGGVSATWKPDDGGIPIPPNVAAEIENVFKDSERPGVVYTPGEPEIPCGGPDAVLGQEIPVTESKRYAEQIALLKRAGKELRDIVSENRLWMPQAAGFGSSVEQKPSAAHPPGYFIVEDQQPSNSGSEVREFTTKQLPVAVAIGDAPLAQLWLLMRPNGEYVKSTTEEGGESYISCTSHEEAVKVAEHQKVFDIECVPYRVF